MRREKSITIKDGDNNLKFKIRQMSAMDAHDFIAKAMLAAGSSANGITPIASAMDGGGLGPLLSVLGGIDFSNVQELGDKLLACCSRIIDGGIEMICTRSDIDGYITDYKTIFKLYSQAVEVNFPEFFAARNEADESPSSSTVKVHSGRPRKSTEQPAP